MFSLTTFLHNAINS